MKKHISLVIVFSILLLALTNISPPVKAKQDIQETEYLAIDIYGNEIPNSQYENGLYDKGLLISPYDFIFEDLSEEQKENAFFSFSGFDNYMYLSYNSGTAEEIEIAKQNFILRTGMSEDGTYHFPFFYITSIKDFESYLIDSGYIREGESYKDIDVSEFGSRLEILERLEERKLGYLISKNNIPGYFYQSSYISSDTNILELNIIYKIDELYDYYICNGKISYTNSSSSDDLIYEKSELTLPDSFGKIKAISANKFIYEYSLLYYKSEFGYFGLNQDSEIYTIELDISQIPSFLFDTKGNLKDDYVSFKSGYWYLIKIQNVNKQVTGKYAIERKLYSHGVSPVPDMYFYICYFNFDFPVDTLEYIKFYIQLVRKEFFIKTYYDYCCTLYKGSKINVTYTNDYSSDLSFFENLKNFFNHSETEENVLAIQAGHYKIYDDYYDFKVYFINDDSPLINEPSIFPYYFNTTEIYDVLEMKYTYKSIIFYSDNIVLTPGEGYFPSDPGSNNNNNCINIFNSICEGLKELWNWNYPYGMFIILGFLAICIILLIIYFPGFFKVVIKIIIFPFKLILNLFGSIFNKKNKSI